MTAMAPKVDSAKRSRDRMPTATGSQFLSRIRESSGRVCRFLAKIEKPSALGNIVRMTS
jgi:hypothetical protein